ncbi:hypothetical protein BDA99DRAFT_119253 [Phascolomyces articulosus]|uniref:Uncharacterized protein n=1 Tax=Phascolomyces articulosus TaxID=60185 RepID=A0AAD5PJ39_9FUNG|nr:hypothetical protein BDA99DRAFT_119253 [Phascolomyces articulosus]
MSIHSSTPLSLTRTHLYIHLHTLTQHIIYTIQDNQHIYHLKIHTYTDTVPFIYIFLFLILFIDPLIPIHQHIYYMYISRIFYYKTISQN